MELFCPILALKSALKSQFLLIQRLFSEMLKIYALLTKMESFRQEILTTFFMYLFFILNKKNGFQEEW